MQHVNTVMAVISPRSCDDSVDTTGNEESSGSRYIEFSIIDDFSNLFEVGLDLVFTYYGHTDVFPTTSFATQQI